MNKVELSAIPYKCVILFEKELLKQTRPEVLVLLILILILLMLENITSFSFGQNGNNIFRFRILLKIRGTPIC